MAGKDRDREVTYELIRHIGVVGRNHSTGWRRELNEVAWNGNPSKYDLRDWDEEHKLMSRGITLNGEEAKLLFGLLKEEMDNV